MGDGFGSQRKLIPAFTFKADRGHSAWRKKGKIYWWIKGLKPAGDAGIMSYYAQSAQTRALGKEAGFHGLNIRHIKRIYYFHTVCIQLKPFYQLVGCLPGS